MTNRDPATFDPRIAGWLENDPNEAPDPTLQVVLAALPSIDQRRGSRLPWRFVPMRPIAPTAVAVLVLVVAVGGAVFLLRPTGAAAPGVDGGSPSPSALPSASAPTPSTTPSPTAAAPSPSTAGNAFPVGVIPAGTYATTTFNRPGISLTIPDGWSRKRDDREVFALSRGESVLAFTHDSTSGEVPPGSTAVTLGDLVAYEEIPAAPSGADPTLETGRNGPTLYVDEGLNPYDTRIGSVTASWTVDVGGARLPIKFNGPPADVAATLEEVRSILASMEATP